MSYIKSTDLTLIVKELCEYDSEREWFEFKENWYEAEELGQYISALSNSATIAGKKFGYFIWGIDDKSHEIVGTSFNYNQNVKNEPLKHFLSRQINPDVNFIFDDVVIDEKRIVILSIPAAKNIPTAYKSERYIRIGSSKSSLRKYPQKEAYLFEVLRQGLPTIENTPAEYQDLKFEQLLIYYGAKGLSLNMETFKRNLSFFTENGKYNILAQLLSDNSHVPIRVAIFSGTTKADNMYSVREFGNQCILYSLDEILRYGDVLNILQADERDRVVERKEIPLFENDAFREAIVNAFVHNKWINGDGPMISVFSNRIEILSRGTLAPEQTMDGFFAGESIPVNRKLSEIFLQLHISEKTGRGVPTITQRYSRDAYEFNENSIVVRIPFNWINVMGDRAGDKEGDKSINYPLNNTQLRILAEIRNNHNITKPQLASTLKLGKTTIDKGISVLRKYEFIERVGSNKTGYWKVLKW